MSSSFYLRKVNNAAFPSKLVYMYIYMYMYAAYIHYIVTCIGIHVLFQYVQYIHVVFAGDGSENMKHTHTAL